MKRITGLLLTMVILSACGPLSLPAATATLPAITRTAYFLATETPTPLGPQQPPACTFPLAQIPTPQSTPESYIFSEPQIVLIAQKGNFYNIIEWLPDSQQVLITEDLLSSFFNQNDNAPQQSISLYNPETGESKIYAIRAESSEPPVWQPDLNAVVYSAINYTSIDKKAGIYKFIRQLWVSYGDPNTAQMLDDNLTQLYIAVKPGGNETMYLSGKQISKLDNSLKKLPSISFDLDQWDYSKKRGNKSPIPYHMAWQPGTSLIFLYSDGYSERGGYTFILNTDKGQICELNLGGWATVAHWSPDGHYLAIGQASDTHAAALTLLDTTTGNLTILRGAPQGSNGQLYLNDFIWAPDNHHLLAIGSIVLSQNFQSTNSIQGLYLVDIMFGQSIDLTPDNFSVNSLQSMAWSPDGSKLAIRCPAMGIDRICILPIQKSGQ